VAPGDLIGRVLAEGALAEGALAGQTAATSNGRDHAAAPGGSDGGAPGGQDAAAQVTEGMIVTKPARDLIDSLGLTMDRVRDLGVKIVRKSDVERLAAETGQPQTRRLPAAQVAVARTVTESHDTIPAAFTAVRVSADAALRAAQVASGTLDEPVGLPEFLITAVSRLHETFPMAFASPAGDQAVRLADDAHVGVTIDVGRGLYVPVIRAASGRTLTEIAGILAGFRRIAMDGQFSEHDLAGGNLTVTLHPGLDVLMAIPIVFPGQTCSLALTGQREEVGLDADGKPVARAVVSLGLAYDHRFINGREAMAFLRSVKTSLESPERLVAP
jgi:2-oxoglutarate dehydrogenase E2 component (dihydrolipoamide succinyltransferase)